MPNYTVLNEPKKTRAAGQQILLETATGMLPGVITGKTGAKLTRYS